MDAPPVARRIATVSTTVFSEFSALAQQHDAINLGQGFPDFDGPDELKEVALRAIREGRNQYAVGQGALELREAIAEHAARFYKMNVDPSSMVSVTCGATEAIFDALMGLVNPGDEVILFEPFYDSYEASIVMAGGVPRHVRLHPPDSGHARWWFDGDELASAFSPRTRLLLLNTPHNPTGKVFDELELSRIAQLCIRHDALCVSDEVYEHLVFAPSRHLRIASLPGMDGRTITIGSGGKSFSFTGWKVGWAIAPPALLQAVQRTHQFVTFATPVPFQLAIASALRLPDDYFVKSVQAFQGKRDLLAQALAEAGLSPLATEGTYFLMADTAGVGPADADDIAFCRWLTAEVGVAAIPPSAFYRPASRSYGRRLARLAFCKTQAALEEAARRLRVLGQAGNALSPVLAGRREGPRSE